MGFLGKLVTITIIERGAVLIGGIRVSNKKVPAATIRRLPRYYRYLSDLLKDEIYRISSGELSRRMGVTASQIRQDLNFFGGFGQQGYGYNVEYLYHEIGQILGVEHQNGTIIIGGGKLGQALANYPALGRRGFLVLAIFDVNPKLVGTKIGDLPVYHIDQLEEFMEGHDVRVAILTLPKEASEDVAMRLADCGIRGVLNFSYVDLHMPPTVAVENVHLTDSLLTLSYKITKQEEQQND